ncbi:MULTISPECIES: M23 family metallopeptidase [unclassified Microbacterium]|uniref:M23 family metallopeptidase n=1 Tax=unclassified Microbacterium TaxID=2609290 RepID=UPI00301ADF62
MTRRPLDEPVRITGDRASHAEYGVGPASDYGCGIGTPVLAPFAGRVSTYVTSAGGLGVVVEGADATFYGQHLWVRLGSGWYEEGDRIALSGNSGTQTTGPHLHSYVIVHATGERLSMEEYLTITAASRATPFSPPTPKKDTDMRIIHIAGTPHFHAGIPGKGMVHIADTRDLDLLQRYDRGDVEFNDAEKDIIGAYLRGEQPAI